MDFVAAIRGRRLVSFEYDGFTRVVQPATYGQTTTRKLTLRGCQVGGDSHRNSVPCWELYTEAKMGAASVMDAGFQLFALAGYTRGDSAFVSILAEH